MILCMEPILHNYSIKNRTLKKENKRKANPVLPTLTHFRILAQQRSLLQSVVHGDPIEQRLLLSLSLWTSFNFFNQIFLW